MNPAILTLAAMLSNPAHAGEVYTWEWNGQHRFTSSATRKVRKVTAYLCPGEGVHTRAGGSIRTVEEEMPPSYKSTEGRKPMSWPEGWVSNEESKALCGVSHLVPKVGMYYENQVDAYISGWVTKTYESWEKLPYPWAREALMDSFQKMLTAPEWKAPSGKEGEPDCLASYCLGQTLTDDLRDTLSGGLAKVAGTFWGFHLEQVAGTFWGFHLETCSGRVVSVTLTSPEPDFIDNRWVLRDGNMNHESYLETPIEREWLNGYAPNHPKPTRDRVFHYYPGETLVVLEKDGRMGFREVRAELRSGKPGYSVTIKTTHPDYDALCASKLQQGL